MSLFDVYPIPWSDRRFQELRGALATTLFERSVIVDVIVAAGLSPGDVYLDQSARLLWRAVLDYAAGQLLLPQLMAEVQGRYPALRAKVDELEATHPRLAAGISEPIPVDDGRWKNFSSGQQERQIVAGQHTLLDVAFLEAGLISSRSVCRIIGSAVSGPFYGTGFRIGPSLILTNHHVLFDWEAGDQPASSVSAEFGYEVGRDGRLLPSTTLTCDTSSIKGEHREDWAVVKTDAPMPDDFPALPLPRGGTIQVDQRVCIIQHPLGLPKKIALAHNLVRYVDPNVVQYWTDTEAGSSGSPVFDEQWRVVALHHQWVEAPDDDGTAYRNQGRSIGRVVERMAMLGVSGVGIE
jgi:hypothetical protein